MGCVSFPCKAGASPDARWRAGTGLLGLLLEYIYSRPGQISPVRRSSSPLPIADYFEQIHFHTGSEVAEKIYGREWMEGFDGIASATRHSTPVLHTPIQTGHDVGAHASHTLGRGANLATCNCTFLTRQSRRRRMTSVANIPAMPEQGTHNAGTQNLLSVRCAGPYQHQPTLLLDILPHPTYHHHHCHHHTHQFTYHLTTTLLPN